MRQNANNILLRALKEMVTGNCKITAVREDTFSYTVGNSPVLWVREYQIDDSGTVTFSAAVQATATMRAACDTGESEPRNMAEHISYVKRMREWAINNILSNSNEVTRGELDSMPLDDIATLDEMLYKTPPGSTTLINSAIRSLCGKPARPEPVTADYSLMGFPAQSTQEEMQARYAANKAPTMADAMRLHHPSPGDQKAQDERLIREWRENKNNAPPTFALAVACERQKVTL